MLISPCETDVTRSSVFTEDLKYAIADIQMIVAEKSTYGFY